MDARVERRLGWITKDQQRFPKEKAEDWLDAIRQQLCPICGEGPWVVVASHVYKRHGITSAELKEMLGLFKNESICDPVFAREQGARTRASFLQGNFSIDGDPLGTIKLAQAARTASRGKIRSPKKGKPSPRNQAPPQEPIDIKWRQHGTDAGYVAGCRCADCRRSNLEKFLRQRANRMARLESSNVTHGNKWIYSNWGCRCKPCCDAWAVHMAEQRDRRRQSKSTPTKEQPNQ